MRKLLPIAIALTLGSISVPAFAQATPVFESWGTCKAFIRQKQREAELNGNNEEQARWSSAWCHAYSFKHVAVILPF